MKKRFKVTVTLTFDADNVVLAKAIAAQGKSIAIGEWSKHSSRSEVAALMQTLRPDIAWTGPEEVIE